MKFKHINVSNCRFLLPELFDLRVLRDFDKYLEAVDNSDEHNGVVGKLIQKNQITQGKKPWDRFLKYDIEVCFDMNFQTKVPLAIKDSQKNSNQNCNYLKPNTILGVQESLIYCVLEPY